MANRERVEEEFEVPASAVPVILGKGAQVVNKIRNDTGAYVHVSEKNGKGLVVVRGNAEQGQSLRFDPIFNPNPYPNPNPNPH